MIIEIVAALAIWHYRMQLLECAFRVARWAWRTRRDIAGLLAAICALGASVALLAALIDAHDRRVRDDAEVAAFLALPPVYADAGVAK